MKDFAHASFSPEKIEAMTSALQSAIDTLPEPVSSRVIHRLAEAILRAARDGESNARDQNLILAVIASFLAWIITQLLRIAFG
jgi:hypothetical protein